MEGGIVHLIEIVARMCGRQTRLCSPMLALVLGIGGKKPAAICYICFNNHDIVFFLRFFFFLFLNWQLSLSDLQLSSNCSGPTEQTHVLSVPEGWEPTLRVMDATKRLLPSPWVTAPPCRCAGARAYKI